MESLGHFPDGQLCDALRDEHARERAHALLHGRGYVYDAYWS